MKVYSRKKSYIYRSKYVKISYIGSYNFNIDQYMLTYFDHICFHISVIIRPQHISVNISSFAAAPPSGAYRPIYVRFQLFKLVAYIAPIYVWVL